MPVPRLESGISLIIFILAGNATGILGFPDLGKTRPGRVNFLMQKSSPSQEK
jgi:hypothetical protein